MVRNASTEILTTKKMKDTLDNNNCWGDQSGIPSAVAEITPSNTKQRTLEMTYRLENHWRMVGWLVVDVGHVERTCNSWVRDMVSFD